MKREPELIEHITDSNDFYEKCIENKALAFPELEKIMHDYILSQPKETMEFTECLIHEEQGENGEEDKIRNVHVSFKDHNSSNYIRLSGSKNNDGRVLNMKVDALDMKTNELVYERQLA